MLVPLLAMLFGVVVTIAVAQQVDKSERRLIVKQLKRDLNQWVSVIQFSLDEKVSLFSSIIQIYEDQMVLTAETFSEKSKNMMQLYPHIEEVYWVPQVDGKERERYESIRKKNAPNFSINDFSPGSGFIRAPSREVYYPIYYQRIRNRQCQSLGWDLAGIDILQNTWALDSHINKNIAIQFLPSYFSSPTIDGIKLELQMLLLSRLNILAELPDGSSGPEIGFLTVMSKTTTMFSYLKNIPSFDKLRISVISGQGSQVKPVFELFTYTGELLFENTISSLLSSNSSSYWSVMVTPTDAYFKEQSSTNVSWVVAIGLLGTALFTIYVMSVNRREQIIQDLVDEKTTQLLQVNQELDRLTHTDYLTGVSNRRLFDETLDLEWSRAARQAIPLTLIILDVDFFKQFNDRYGHIKGDECLRQLAQTLRSAIKRPGDILARYGGEEFAILLTCTDKNATVLAEQCRKAVQDLKIENQDSLVSKFVTISLGIVTTIPCSGQRSIELLEYADKALYQAKEQGRNRVVVGQL